MIALLLCSFAINDMFVLNNTVQYTFFFHCYQLYVEFVVMLRDMYQPYLVRIVDTKYFTVLTNIKCRIFTTEKVIGLCMYVKLCEEDSAWLILIS